MSKSVIDHHARDEIQQRNKNRKTKTNASFNNVTQDSSINHTAKEIQQDKKSKFARGAELQNTR